MIGIDTNALLRCFLDDDDPDQSRRVREAVRANAPILVNDIVLVEFAWTCKRVFKLARAEIHRRLEAMIEAPEFAFANSEGTARAVAAYGLRACDFADVLIGETNLALGCTTTLTFDRDAAKGSSCSQIP